MALKQIREIAQAANCALSLVDDQEILANKCPTRVWEMDGLFVATTEPNDAGASIASSSDFSTLPARHS